MKVSTFHGVAPTVSDNRTIDKVLCAIKSGTYRKQVERVRAEADKAKRDELKRQLMGFTASGTFNGTRKADALLEHSGFIVLDFDNLADAHAAKESVAADEYTFAAFISPSGNGLKCLVRIDGAKHRESFKQLSAHFKERHGLTADESGKDVSRLCFVSYDPDIYLNENSKTFIAIDEPKPLVPLAPVARLQSPPAIDKTQMQRDAQRALEAAVKPLQDALNGQRHAANTRQSTLIGGFIAGGFVDESVATSVLETVILGKFEPERHAEELRTMRECIEFGKGQPITYEQWLQNRADFFVESGQESYKSDKPAPNVLMVEQTAERASHKSDGGKAKKKIEFAVQTTNELTETPVEWICEGMFARKCITEIFGDAGSGKSLLIQSMFQHQDCNGLNLPMKSNLRALYVLGKDFFGNAAKQRQAAIGGKYTLLHNIEEIMVDMRNPLDADAFIAGAKKHRLDAIVFDTKRDFFTGESRADDVAATTMSSFRKIANELDCAVILISHGCKSHMNVSINSIVGSQVWGAKLDVAWYIQSGDGGIFQITNVKDRHNGGWRGKQIKFRMVLGSGVVASQEPFKVTATESNAAIIAGNGGRPKIADIETGETILDALQTEFWTGDFVSEATRKGYMSERTAKSLLYELRDAGKVKPMHKQGLWIRATTPGGGSNCATTYTHTDVFAQSINEVKPSILTDNEPF